MIHLDLSGKSSLGSKKVNRKVLGRRFAPAFYFALKIFSKNKGRGSCRYSRPHLVWGLFHFFLFLFSKPDDMLPEHIVRVVRLRRREPKVKNHPGELRLREVCFPPCIPDFFIHFASFLLSGCTKMYYTLIYL